VITSNHQEEFSYAFVRAVVASAGCSIAVPKPDRNSIDLTISSEEHRCPKIDVQVKSTKNFSLSGDQIPYPLNVDNYKDLIAEVTTPRILILVTLPSTPEHWLNLSEESMRLQHCAYWASLKGLPPKDAKETVTVYLNRSDLFNVKTLHAIMEKLSNGIDL
jgi:hypothetical protein